MEIKKVMRIETPVQLYRLMDRDLSVFQQCDDAHVESRLQLFYEYVGEYLYGCRCDEDLNWQRSEREYRELSEDAAVVDRLKYFYGCDRIEFVMPV